MASAKKQPPAPVAPPAQNLSYGQQMAATLAEIRVAKIRECRARVPTPSYDQIAVECGCSVKTVYNVVTGKTHAP
jgi:hypothetical protein